MCLRPFSFTSNCSRFCSALAQSSRTPDGQQPLTLCTRSLLQKWCNCARSAPSDSNLAAPTRLCSSPAGQIPPLPPSLRVCSSWQVPMSTRRASARELKSAMARALCTPLHKSSPSDLMIQLLKMSPIARRALLGTIRCVLNQMHMNFSRSIQSAVDRLVAGCRRLDQCQKQVLRSAVILSHFNATSFFFFLFLTQFCKSWSNRTSQSRVHGPLWQRSAAFSRISRQKCQDQVTISI